MQSYSFHSLKLTYDTRTIIVIEKLYRININGGFKMDRIEHVSVVKKANVYFDGKVTSRIIYLESGEKKTLGIIMPGEYEFDTADKELMEIQAGKLNVLLPNSKEWIIVEAGQSFEIPANSIFKVEAQELCDYCCSYFKE